MKFSIFLDDCSVVSGMMLIFLLSIAYLLSWPGLSSIYLIKSTFYTIKDEIEIPIIPLEKAVKMYLEDLARQIAFRNLQQYETVSGD